MRLVRRVVEDLKLHGRVLRGEPGLTLAHLTAEQLRAGGGALITEIERAGAAFIAGLQAGDEILAVDGQDTIIWQEVTLRLLARMGETGNIVFTIDPAGSDQIRDVSIPILSWMGDDTEPDPAGNLGIVEIEVPAVIGKVHVDGRAEASGLLAGDEILLVNDKPIRGWTHWVEVIRASPVGREDPCHKI